MTFNDIDERLSEIRKIKGDDEYAHVAEKELWGDFIAHVAAVGPEELSKMANLVLSTEDIEFCRWYA